MLDVLSFILDATLTVITFLGMMVLMFCVFELLSGFTGRNEVIRNKCGCIVTKINYPFTQYRDLGNLGNCKECRDKFMRFSSMKRELED